ncbi:lasso peptide biosynthesis B2 protein [Streptomyces sp. NPDC001787]|uniref:lasso peptide biosynthesis B2 protein n=1 Tax=Streptomyces sp. NPDC001787 TaxID=3154523 RepID=UPI00332A2CF7
MSSRALGEGTVRNSGCWTWLTIASADSVAGDKGLGRRCACLEESVAAVLVLASRRLGVRCCHGIASDPIRLHAWVQTMNGDDVAELSSTHAYTPVLTIGDRHHQLR